MLWGGRDGLGVLGEADIDLSLPQREVGAAVPRAEVSLLKDAPRAGVPPPSGVVGSVPSLP